MIIKTARAFRPDLIPPLARPSKFNGDLSLGSLRPTMLVWPGEQRRGIAMRVTDAIAIDGRVKKSLAPD